MSQPVYSCALDQFVGVGMFCQMWALCEALRKWNGFGVDVIAEQPSHPCLHAHNTVCHVTPLVLSSDNKRCRATETGHVWCVPFVMNDKEAHMWMAEPCNQPHVPPIAFNHNTHTIGHACPITHLYPHTPWCTHTWLDGGGETG